MEFYELLIEKGKEEGVIKNVVGAILLNCDNKFLVMGRKKDDFMVVLMNFLAEMLKMVKQYMKL